MKKLLKVFIAFFLVAIFLYFENNFIVTDNIKFNTDRKINEPIKILHLSDLHNRKIEWIFSSFSKNIQKNKPQLVLITGDIVTDSKEQSLKYVDYLHDTLKGIPTYYVTGNHEAANYTFLKEFKSKMEDNGFICIDGEKKTIDICGQSLTIAGLKDPSFYEYTTEKLLKVRIASLLPEKSKNFSILLAHRSEYTPIYNQSDFDLILTGHAHGGVIGIPFSKGNLYSSSEGFFPKYTKGLHKKTYISRGLGGGRFNFRLFNHPQMSYITLKP